MKKILLLSIAFFFSFILGYGQNASSYCLTSMVRPYTPLLGAMAVPGTLTATTDDGFSSIFPLDAITPFNFTFGGVDYSQIQVSSNGLLSFKSTAINESFYSKTNTDISNRKPFLAPLWDDLANTKKPIYVVTGTAPNRIFKIEWSQQKWNYMSTNPVVSFQVWLYETSNIIEYSYNGEMGNVNSASASIGIYDEAATFLTLNNLGTAPVAQSTTFTTGINTKPASGQVYRFTPPIPSSSVGNYTFCIDNSNSITTAIATSGRYATLNVIKGFNYTFSVGDVFSSQENLTILDDFNNNVSPPITASGNSGISVSWTATISGAIRVLLTGNCSIGGSGPLTLILNSLNNTQDSDTAQSTNSWTGHIYNSVAGAAPEPFTSVNYAGYYNVGSETINESFGGNTACFPVYSNGVQRASIYTEQFAVRYRMKSTRAAGFYFMNANADDGIRATVDGITVLNDWTDHGNKLYCNNLIYLNGNSDIILDYYENTGGNVTGFSLSPVISTVNTISSYADRNVCSGIATGVLDGSNILSCTGTTNTTYQWQKSTDNVNFTDIAGATGEDYTPLAITTTSVDITYYRRVLKAFGVAVTPTNPATGSVKVITSINTIVLSSAVGTDAQTVCKNTAIIPIKYNTIGATGATITGLPTGVTGTWVANVVTISGTPTVSGAALTYTVSLTGGCGSINAVGTRTITVTDNNTAGVASLLPILCMNTTISPNITHTTTGATGIANNGVSGVNGLPAGVSASWSSNTITISGTPTVAGTFNYSIPLTGGCGSASATGTITVNSVVTVTLNKTDETCSYGNNGTITPSLSGGLTNVRYIKLTQKYADWQQVQEIQAFEVFTGTNVALSSNGVTATSSSNYSNDATNYGPQKAIDGDTTGYSFWHSNSTNINEFVKVDLTSGKNIDYIRIYNRVDCCWNRGQNMLLELFDASNNVIYSKNVNLWGGVNGSNYVDVNVLDLSWTDGATTLNRTNLDSGPYIFNYKDVSCTNSSVSSTISSANPSPSAPTLGAITQPCIIATGSIVLNGLPLSGTVNQTGTVTNSYTVTGTTMTISGLIPGTYNFTVSNGSCSSGASGNVVINSVVTKSWDGLTWSPFPLIEPTSSDVIIFAGNYTSLGNLDGCTCTVNAGVKVVFNPTHTLKITNGVNVSTALGTSLTFEDRASLVQVNDNAINTGNIIYKRLTANIIDNFDYNYWSAPVFPQNLLAVSPSTSQDKFYSFNLTTNDWQQENPITKNMVSGIGYIIRGPQTFVAPAPPNFYQASFIGVPNNGIVTVVIPPTAAALEASALIGNPYPSALNADLFLIKNMTTALEGTLYLWTHNTNIGLGTQNLGSGAYAYTSDDYATYNLTGGVLAGGINNSIPNGKIASGQAFFAGVNPVGGTITFNNSMRIGGGILDNSQFFKLNNTKSKENGSVEKDRVWLNFYNSQGAFKQTLVGYITGATNEYDNGYDGATFDGNEFVDFYSINQDKNLVVQGRALPFDEADEVPLGYKTTIVGDFTIDIAQTDGLLATKEIFLEDKEAQTVINLKEGDYKFTTEAGTFNDRFVLRYTNKTLGTGDFNKGNDQVLVSIKNKQIKINSPTETIDKVQVSDLLGRQLFKKNSVNNNELVIVNLVASDQALVVKIILQNGQTVSKKIIY